MAVEPKIADLLAVIQQTFQNFDPEALVVPRRFLGFDEEGFDPDVLRSEQAERKIQAICFWPSGFTTGTEPRVEGFIPAGRRKRTRSWTFAIRTFRQYQTEEAEGSAEAFNAAWLADMADYLAARPKFGLDETETLITSHGDLQFPAPRIRPRLFGQTLLFQADGSLTVTTYKSISQA